MGTQNFQNTFSKLAKLIRRRKRGRIDAITAVVKHYSVVTAFSLPLRGAVNKKTQNFLGECDLLMNLLEIPETTKICDFVNANVVNV